MEKQFVQEENNRGLVTLNFTSEEFKDAIKWSYNRNKGSYELHGFRKGKVPMNVLVQHYGEAIFYDDAVNHLVNPAYIEAIQEFKFEPVSQPELDIEQISDEGLEVSLRFDLEPEAELGVYKGVQAVRPNDEITDADVDAEIKRVQDRNSRLVPVEDRAAEDGDTANIDFEGFHDGEAFDGGQGEAYDLELGSGSFIPGFEEQVVGHEAGEEFDVNVTFPEDYGADELAGQDAVFKVKINSIKKKELPELDDDFAMDVSEFDTFAEYKDSIRAELQEAATENADREFENNVIREAAKNITVDIPESMIESEVDHLYGHQEQDVRQYGMALEDYLGFLGQNVEEFKESLRPAAESQVKVSLLLKAVIREEELELSEEDRETEYESLAERSNLTVEQVKEQVAGNPSYDHNFLLNKAVRFLLEHAEAITEEEAAEVDAVVEALSQAVSAEDETEE